MPPEVLDPTLEHLRQEYVLVQAWKKTVAHLRAHNWYCDTLEVDWTTLNLAEFIEGIQRDLERPELWDSEPLRVVWAPKRQQWRISRGVWQPKRGLKEDRMRPLAHVSLRDQVVSTGIMLCLANRVETRQRDPRSFPTDMESLQDCVTSYGNRLFCDEVDGELRHRWGSKKLYRSFFDDYRSFVHRPTKVADSWKRRGGYRVFVVESDLAQFYDRVHSNDVARALYSIRRPTDGTDFFSFANQVLRWSWDSRDNKAIGRYQQAADLSDFSEVALPQGLIAAGFFANVVLLALDESLRKDLGQEISRGIWVRDVIRYVDDIRVVVTAWASRTREQIEEQVSEWLGNALKAAGPGLKISAEKTAAAEFEGKERPVLLQSVKMERLQKTFSGGFDLLVAQEILEGVRGLLRSQADLKQTSQDQEWGFSPRPDVRDETIARFGAWRYRTTYRSIRPLLDEANESAEAENLTGLLSASGGVQPIRTRRELDNDARVFAFRLVRLWLNDPSNVRVLRIALDI